MGTDMTEVVRDQYGEPWLLFERNGDRWVLGLDDFQEPCLRKVVGTKMVTNWSTKRALRKLDLPEPPA